ncbi:MAG: class A beta-lactamase [Pseudomonadota bacterium]
MKRNGVAVTLLAAAVSLVWMGRAIAADDPVVAAARAAEATLGAKVGLAVHDTGSGRTWLHNADERFPMASTFKALACAALLDAGPERLATSTTIAADDLQSYAPVTKTMVGRRVPASELCAITLRTSDNTAANKVLEILGGPARVTSFLRSIGDGTTRLDRMEPDLNEGRPGDPRDTTTPRAMADTMRKLLLGTALEKAAQRRLTQWLLDNEVGGPLLRAGLPSDWRIADRTGAGGFGTRGVVAVMWPPRRAPLVAAIYVTGTRASMEARNAAIAAIGRAIAAQPSP